VLFNDFSGKITSLKGEMVFESLSPLNSKNRTPFKIAISASHLPINRTRPQLVPTHKRPPRFALTLVSARDMLRTTATALWSRFVPAARQHLTGATAASAQRVSVFPLATHTTRGFRTTPFEPVFEACHQRSFCRVQKKSRTQLTIPVSQPQATRSFCAPPAAGEDEYEIDEHAVRVIN
jgi:hypothetical protein